MAAEPFLIAVLPIQLLDTRMRLEAVVSIGALLLSLNVGAYIARIVATVPFSILSIVIVHAQLVIVGLCDVAGVHFECLEVEMLWIYCEIP